MFKEENEKIRKQILGAVEGLKDEELNRKPAPEKWSAIQILDHLQLMENVITKNIATELEKEESRKAMKKPIQLTVSRAVKVDAPSYTIPSEEFVALDLMKAKLADSRKRLYDLYENASKEILEKKSLPHPVFGQVPLIQWFSFVGLHEKRHYKQLVQTLSEINRQQN